MYSDNKNIINIDQNLESAIILASELFETGKIFIYPTDTIYGIGGNPFDTNAVSRISEIKGRESNKQSIWLLADFENLMNYVEINNENHIEFLRKIWPGPVTVVLKLNERTKQITSYRTVGVRIPRNDFCLKLLGEISRPLISTSVNRSGMQPLVRIKEIIETFSKDVDVIFYESENREQKSSTIIDLTEEKPVLLREGDVKFEDLLRHFN